MKTYPGILSGAVVFISGKVKPAAAQDMLICTDGARKKSNWNIPPLAGLTYRWEEEIAPAQPGWGKKKKSFYKRYCLRVNILKHVNLVRVRNSLV